MNQYQRDLIEDPPPKNPYFLLPSTSNFLTLEDIERAEELRRRWNSLIDLFGPLDKMTDDQQTKFLLTIIKHSSFKPDFEAAARALNISNGHHMQRRFKAIVEKQGFNLDYETLKDDEQVVKSAAPKAAPKTKRGRKPQSATIAPRTETTRAETTTAALGVVIDPGLATPETTADPSYVDAADVEDNAGDCTEDNSQLH